MPAPDPAPAAVPASGRRPPSAAVRRTRRPAPERLVADLLGHRTLRPGQREAIEAVLAGRDVISVMATGSGKSAIYQVGGAVLDGPTLVVSPLIALQHDQLTTLQDGGLDEQLGRAAALNSTMPAAERAEALEAFGSGELEFLFVAPEQLRNATTLAAVAAAEPSLVVVDEAHCVSAWGHDFRPAYGELAEVLDVLGRPVVLCLTATASPPVRDDIVRMLRLDDPVVVVAGFDRPNIHLAVRRFGDAEERDRAVVDTAANSPGDGIVYAATRRRAEQLAARIAEHRPADHYHGTRRRADRDAAQERFVHGDVEVMVATNAFGMGIDKPDVRWVLHADVPDSLDSYQQEMGRAGRDGEPARAVLFHRPEDLGRQRFLTGVRRPAHTTDPDAPPDDDDEQAARRATWVETRLEMIRTYAETDVCRRQQLLSSLGEPFEGPCDACDVCDAARERASAGHVDASRAVDGAPADAPWSVPGTEVVHATWGSGRVLSLAGDRLTVLFDDAGYRNLSARTVDECGLLAVAE